MSEQEVFDALRYRIEFDEYGTQYYYNANDKLHRTNGPAVVWANGTKSWYQNGQLHRTDGPAIERANGTRHWYQNGQRHRVDGAAIEWSDGIMEWFINGVGMTEDEYNQEVKHHG